jgi:hypothetical protein
LKKIIKREKSTSTKGHYVKNAELLPVVLDAIKKNEITPELIKLIWLIAERYSRKSKFINYSYREDMVASAVANLCEKKNALKFDPNRSATPNPFSYYTSAIHNTFLQYLGIEKKHRNLRDELLVEAGSNPSFNYQQEHAEDSSEHVVLSDDLDISDEDPLESDDFHQAARGNEDVEKLKKLRHPKWAGREPGPVRIYKPDEIFMDPETGKVTIVPREETSETPAPKKKRATKKKIVKKKKKTVTRKRG